jgi:hypothetical protein
MASGLPAHRFDSPSLPGTWATGIRHTLLAQFISWHPVAKSVDYIDCDSEISQMLFPRMLDFMVSGEVRGYIWQLFQEWGSTPHDPVCAYSLTGF